MEQQKIKRWLMGLGKRTFVLCFEMFKNNYKSLHYSEIATLIPQYDKDASLNNPINTLPRKATYAVDLFKKNAEIEALKICCSSKRLGIDIQKRAKELLKKYDIDEDCLFKEDFQDIVEKVNPRDINIIQIKNIVPQKIYVKESERYKRNPEVAYAAKLLSGFRCEIDYKHSTFISGISGNQYMEAHHIIPMEFQKNFDYNIDCLANIVSLCPNCHRALHSAQYKYKKKFLEILYAKRSELLLNNQIYLSLDKLLSMYI